MVCSACLCCCFLFGGFFFYFILFFGNCFCRQETSSCLLTELPLDARSLWPAISLHWCKSGGVLGYSLGSVDRTPGCILLLPYTAVWIQPCWASDLCSSDLLLPALKLAQEIHYLYPHRCFKGTWAQILPLILKIASGVCVQSLNPATEAALWF